MIRRVLAGPTIGAIIGAACTMERPTTPDVVADSDVASAGTCSWSPAGPVWIPDGDKQIFSAPGGCDGYHLTINPSSAEFGFNSTCTLKSATTGVLGFLVWGCAEDGYATVEIRDGATLTQTIQVDALP